MYTECANHKETRSTKCLDKTPDMHIQSKQMSISSSLVLLVNDLYTGCCPVKLTIGCCN